MDLKISKRQMELAIKILERRAAKIDNVAMCMGIPASEFDKEHLVMLCNLFANELRKAQKLNNSLLDSQFVGQINRAYVKHTLLEKFSKESGSNPIKYKYEPSIWRRIWTNIYVFLGKLYRE